MYRKVFLSPLFNFPIPWIKEYYQNFNQQADWKHIIFTDLDLKSEGNIEVVKMNNHEFEDLVEKKTGVRPYVPAPSPKFGDVRPAFGLVFEDYIKGFDFWGHTDFDVVLGNLNRFITDDLLDKCDIYGNERNMVNGIFGLYRNSEYVNNLFELCSYKSIFTNEVYQAFDEVAFSRLACQKRDNGELRFISNDWQEHDNMEIHKPDPKVALDDMGNLYNTVTKDEMMCFHFRRTKKWCV
jgi:hypothetical protein